MSYLLDTHALLWWLADDAQLPSAARAIIADANEAIFVSAVSSWEISIKRALGKLQAPEELAEILIDEGFQPLAIEFAHGERAGALPPHHRDPFDRMLVAQAQSANLTLVTQDADIRRYSVRTLWAD